MSYEDSREFIKTAKTALGDSNADLIIEILGVPDYNTKSRKCCCPFHNEKTPSFIYNPSENSFHCFGCGKNYDIVDALQDKHGSYGKALKALSEISGIPWAGWHSTEDLQYRYPVEEVCTDKEKVYRYFEKRGISRRIVDYADVRQDAYGNAVFNYYDLSDRLLTVKYKLTHKPKDGEAKMWFQKNADQTPLLFNMNRCRVDEPLIITEGEPDCLACMEVGYMNVVSIPGGTTNERWIDKNLDWLRSFRSIILCADNDEAGQKMVKSVVPRLGASKTKIVEIPALEYEYFDGTVKTTKDLNDLLIYFGREQARKVIDEAKDSPIESIINLSDVVSVDYEQVDGIPFGLKTVDKGLKRNFYGTLTVLTGMPGAGKSSLLSQMICNALDFGVKTWIYSGELSDSQVKSWLNRGLAGPRHVLYGEGDTTYVPADVVKKIDEAYDEQWFVYREGMSCTIDSLLQSMTDTFERYGVKFFALDNLMTVEQDTSKDENRATTDVVRELAAFARATSTVVVLVCHPKKKSLQDGGPSIYDISGTSNIGNLAHRCLHLQRVTKKERNALDNNSSEADRDLLQHDVILSVTKDRMFGRQDVSFGLYYDNESRRFFTDYDEYARQFRWDTGKYETSLPVPAQLVDADDAEVFG